MIVLEWRLLVVDFRNSTISNPLFHRKNPHRTLCPLDTLRNLIDILGKVGAVPRNLLF